MPQSAGEPRHVTETVAPLRLGNWVSEASSRLLLEQRCPECRRPKSQAIVGVRAARSLPESREGGRRHCERRAALPPLRFQPLRIACNAPRGVGEATHVEVSNFGVLRSDAAPSFSTRLVGWRFAVTTGQSAYSLDAPIPRQPAARAIALNSLNQVYRRSANHLQTRWVFVGSKFTLHEDGR